MNRLLEHADLSKRAEEERTKRSNYRRIIEHDGVPRQQPSMQVFIYSAGHFLIIM